MKLTHCQIGKLFLLLTAFFLLLDSQQLVGVLCSAENVAIERLNALDADTTGEQTTVTAIRQAQATAITNVTAVSAVQIVDKVCGRNKNNNNSKKSSNNSKKLLETCVEVESQPQENAEIFAIEVPRKTFEYTTTTTEATTAKGYNVLHAPSIAHPIDAELMSTVEATETQQFRAEVTNAQEQQNVAQLQHKLITTRTNTTRSATLTAGTTNVATTKLESFGKLSGAQNVASIKAATERQMAHNVQQQQVPSQKQQQQRKAQMHRPQEQFDTMRQPLATITTNSTTKLATTQVSAHIATEMKKLQKFETEMSQQQLPKQQQQQRLKSTNKENKAKRPIQKHVNPEIRKQRKQKPLEFVLGQQQQQQHAAQQQLLTSKPRATRNRQPQQSATEWRRQQQVYEQLQQDAQHVPAAHESLRQQQHTAERRQHVGVLIPSRILDVLHVQQGFYNFLDFFHVNLQNVSVDFIHDDDISGFIKLLEHPKYTTVVKTLNTGINLSDDELPLNGKSTSATVAATLPSQRQSHQQQRRLQQQSVVTPAQINNATAAFMKVGEMKKSSSSSNAPLVAYCHLAEQLSRDFNKTVLVWPCPRMKESSNFLPSFEAISYAVKSIATKLNWTHVDIYVGDENWGMPLAIAANLHVPYKIEIADDIRDLQAQDKIGKAIIITADMNDASTLQLLTQLVGLQHTKVLLIDVVATSFNAENNFYKNLARINGSAELMSNLLLLTVLSDKYRYFLKVAFEDNGIGLVQNFRQMRRWKAMTNDGKRGPETGMLNWPMHLDSSVTRALQEHEEAMAAEAFVGDNEKPATTTTSTTTVRPTRDTLAAFDECPQLSGLNFVEICPNIENVTARCVQFLQQNHKDNKNTTRNGKVLQQLRTLLKQLCHIHPVAGHSRAEQARIANLRNFIDFFHFYDFIITSIRQQLAALATKPNPTKKKQVNVSTTKLTENRNGNAGDIDTPAGVISAQMPKYDFIVLDVVHENATANNNNHNNNNKSSVATNAAMLDFNSGVKTDTINSAADTESTASMDSIKWRPLLILEQHEINSNTYITHSLQPGYDEWLLVSTAQLWQCGAICWTIVAICIGLLLIIVAASVAAGIAMRNYFLRKRLSKGPNKIVLSADDFVFPVDSRRVDEGIEAMLCCWLQQLQEFGGPEVDKPDLLKGSIGSLKNLGLIIPGGGTATAAGGAATANGGKGTSGTNSLARHNPALLDMRARYNGDLVQLKEIPLNGSTELKAKAMDLLVVAHGMRHENINPLIGWLSDPNRTAMVFDYCSRGSLQDVLIMDEIKLDWSFRLSLLTDLVRGMRYLHTSPLRVHGTLTSRNCVVDARWVLKITDYVLPSFYESQNLLPPTRTAKELLWTAPELLRSMKTNHHHHGRVLGTQMGDVYSFGIIMQEVVVRGEPYCMLSLSPDEIIAKIKKPPPLIRPSVSKGAAPPEAINIMRQCWAEQPDMRPDFNSVYERFKMLNHGRKVNFVDTMFQMLEKYSNNLEELIRERTDQLDIERKKTEQLLNRMLPSSVAEKLKMGLAVEPEEFSDVTIYFSDIVGFTTIAAHCSPVQVVDLLNDLYTIFDATINAYNVYKVETIGDAYMVVSGLPVKIPDHAEQIATMALDLLHQSGRFNVKHLPGVPLQLRIGLHTGPCCAGVVGLTMPRYCLFGDTVNTASRMESTGSSWRIHMSQETRDRLEARGGYTIEQRGLIEIKGKGMMNTFWLLGKKGFDKPLPAPPPIGLDESLIRNSITLKAQANKSRNSTNPSSSQSSSLAGESVEVKVEITPPTNADICSSNLPNSYSLDSTSTNTISPNVTLCPDFPAKTPNASPQSRKMSELSPENLLTPGTFNRLPSSAGGSSSRLYKKIEEMMDLSSPYNHYKCLSPSESNLTQFYDGKYLYSGGGVCSAVGGGTGSGGGSVHSSSVKFDSKPGSSRLLRRQFSLDRDDTQSKSEHHHHHQHHQSSLQGSFGMTLTNKSSMLDIPILHETSRSPKGTLARAHKQNSTSITQDLEKIEEIPLSPASSQHHSSLDSNLNRSPPSTVEAQTPPATLAAALLSAPTSPAPSRTLNGVGYNMGVGSGAVTESPTTDASTATTTASANSNNTTPGEESGLRRNELTLNVETLLSR
ncbi:uncharacterized protein LOC105218644 isoform X2 [Zeugodacus cucurbitae]|uniref:uncharacterized protein LOC105218644 isoform X2 n=1 Tax=Zeugodacus cucurbitae TaxID=28588 RepID=UPI0023D956C3|nr:uncharacterized protein LOC105218644 isoform X2 [Zeugodacus cucurbitae]